MVDSRQTHDTGGKPWIPCARLLPPPVNLSDQPNCVRFHMLPILATAKSLVTSPGMKSTGILGNASLSVLYLKTPML
jgi:hypothetical protein